jgi:hypothetical protein
MGNLHISNDATPSARGISETPESQNRLESITNLIDFKSGFIILDIDVNLGQALDDGLHSVDQICKHELSIGFEFAPGKGSVGDESHLFHYRRFA